ncbi:hypothetical protein Nepgr_033884 [Nepenthes gracilis]|uniref:Uncharacterized protein n=1 Tax=Nepenthes gracilis TaxID=150966 RepID=A0AAD3Y8P8_NEPGR|nr:hypothetical protein Nepgr_033884 [Nepenthes gracilis]
MMEVGGQWRVSCLPFCIVDPFYVDPVSHDETSWSLWKPLPEFRLPCEDGLFWCYSCGFKALWEVLFGAVNQIGGYQCSHGPAVLRTEFYAILRLCYLHLFLWWSLPRASSVLCFLVVKSDSPLDCVCLLDVEDSLCCLVSFFGAALPVILLSRDAFVLAAGGPFFFLAKTWLFWHAWRWIKRSRGTMMPASGSDLGNDAASEVVSLEGRLMSAMGRRSSQIVALDVMAAWLGCGWFKLSWDAIVRWLETAFCHLAIPLCDGWCAVEVFGLKPSRLQFLFAAIRITTMWLLSSHVLHVMMRRSLALFERMRADAPSFCEVVRPEAGGGAMVVFAIAYHLRSGNFGCIKGVSSLGCEMCGSTVVPVMICSLKMLIPLGVVGAVSCLAVNLLISWHVAQVGLQVVEWLMLLFAEVGSDVDGLHGLSVVLGLHGPFAVNAVVVDAGLRIMGDGVHYVLWLFSCPSSLIRYGLRLLFGAAAYDPGSVLILAFLQCFVFEGCATLLLENLGLSSLLPLFLVGCGVKMLWGGVNPAHDLLLLFLVLSRFARVSRIARMPRDFAVLIELIWE